MDIFEKELMLPTSKSAIRKCEKTVSIFPVDDDILKASEEYKEDEGTRLMYIMRSRPVEYGDIYKLDILDSDMERIAIKVEGCTLVRASDITKVNVEKMGLTVEEGQTPYDVYKEHMTKCDVVIEPDTYVYCVHFSYCKKKEK